MEHRRRLNDLFRQHGATEILPIACEQHVPVEAIPSGELLPLLSAALELGYYRRVDGRVARISPFTRTPLRPLRVPLQPLVMDDYFPDLVAQNKGRYVINIHGGSWINPAEQDEHTDLMLTWHNDRHYQTSRADMHNTTSLLQQSIRLPRIRMDMRHALTDDLCGAIYYTTLVNNEGQSSTYADAFYYDPPISVQDRLGFMMLTILMQHTAQNKQQYMYLGPWHPQRGHSLSYKARLSPNAEVLDQGQWINAHKYRDSLKP